MMPTLITDPSGLSMLSECAVTKSLYQQSLNEPEKIKDMPEGTDLVILTGRGMEDGEQISASVIAAAAAAARSVAKSLTDRPIHGPPVVLSGLIAPRCEYPAFPESTQETELDSKLLAVRVCGLNGTVLDFTGGNPTFEPMNEYTRIVQAITATAQSLQRNGLPPNQARVYPAIGPDAALSVSIDRNDIIEYLAAQLQALMDMGIGEALWVPSKDLYTKDEKEAIKAAFLYAERVSL